MHSRIFQVSKTPIYKEDYITEADYYDHWFTNEIADYVDGDTDRNYDIEWLGSRCGLKICSDEDGNKYLVIASKEDYFKGAFETFCSAMSVLRNMTLDDFVDSYGSHQMWMLKNAYDDKFGFYIDDCGEYHGVTTLDSFVRYCQNGDKYYLGGTIDYHY